MTKTHHPNSKFERKLIEEKKHKFVYEKKNPGKRASEVRRKLALEQAKVQETEHELKEYTRTDERDFSQ